MSTLKITGLTAEVADKEILKGIDLEINLIACLTELMVECEFK